jgi:hypothetical protein
MSSAAPRFLIRQLPLQAQADEAWGGEYWAGGAEGTGFYHTQEGSHAGAYANGHTSGHHGEFQEDGAGSEGQGSELHGAAGQLPSSYARRAVPATMAADAPRRVKDKRRKCALRGLLFWLLCRLTSLLVYMPVVVLALHRLACVCPALLLRTAPLP